jgi:hypothetical protein
LISFGSDKSRYFCQINEFFRLQVGSFIENSLYEECRMCEEGAGEGDMSAVWRLKVVKSEIESRNLEVG